MSNMSKYHPGWYKGWNMYYWMIAMQLHAVYWPGLEKEITNRVGNLRVQGGLVEIFGHQAQCQRLNTRGALLSEMCRSAQQSRVAADWNGTMTEGLQAASKDVSEAFMLSLRSPCEVQTRSGSGGWGSWRRQTLERQASLSPRWGRRWLIAVCRKARLL